jgi:pimeloyl-ACP methyl ester carboxylesterase
MSPARTTRRVPSGDVEIALTEHSPTGPGRPTVVLVHGYPDRQQTWDRLVERLPRDSWHVVTYDVRGAGASDVPADRSAYRTEKLVDDLVAVLDDVLDDGEAAHLVGHDWGSVQLWDAVAAEAADPRLRGRIASFTSISGPSLDHLALLNRHPRGRRGRLLRQGLHSWYVYAFQVPVLPGLAWRTSGERIGRAVAKREGLPADHWGPGLAADAEHSLELYRANVVRRMRRPPEMQEFRTDVPVLVVHPRRDRFLTSVLLEDLDERCSDLRIETVDAGHWVTVTHPELVADLVRQHVEAH